MRVRFAGKLVGATVGLVVGGGPIGALAGGLLGHVLDELATPEDPDDRLHSTRRIASSASDIDAEAQTAFVTHLVGLFAAVASCDGSVRREEVRRIRAFFSEGVRLSGADLDLVRRLLKKAISEPIDVDAACDWYRGNSTHADRLLLVQALYEVALGDGALVDAEQRLLDRIARRLGLEEGDHRAVRRLFFGSTGIDADYATLGLAPDADTETVKNAYRTLAAQHHPDKVTHLGPDAVALAGKRFAEIKAAYDRIRNARGIAS